MLHADSSTDGLLPFGASNNIPYADMNYAMPDIVATDVDVVQARVLGVDNNPSAVISLVEPNVPVVEACAPSVEAYAPMVDTMTSIVPRRSSRSIHLPSYLRDYHCHLVFSFTFPQVTFKYPLQNYLSYDRLSPSFRQFVLNVSAHFKPTFYHQAVPHLHWRHTMQYELKGNGS